ncbi:hypothetical protein M422DRAFT_275924 [Sphaerobolus stellatus SS14]|uniref:Uncharacterized protein n=1 Tax=Sphaerobolus stellatus (strain SS14) TaxID=990650 RepID=A0A0C9T3L9_SPHS4|nr:hypothetical protein M422DRAFT_275924 [Sphaerobolus stellatus SS14]
MLQEIFKWELIYATEAASPPPQAAPASQGLNEHQTHAAALPFNIPRPTHPGPRFLSYGGHVPQATHSIGSFATHSSQANRHLMAPPSTPIKLSMAVAPQDTILNVGAPATLENSSQRPFDVERDGPEISRQLIHHIESQDRMIEDANQTHKSEIENAKATHIANYQSKRQHSAGSDVLDDSTDTAESATSVRTRKSTRGRKRGRGSAKKTSPTLGGTSKRNRRTVEVEDDYVDVSANDPSPHTAPGQSSVTMIY